jgi:hypothetical protein
LALICAVPVHQFLLIGVNLEKSRVLYLPSVGFALLFAAAIAGMNRPFAIPAAAAILAFQTAALEHNLLIWRSVAQLAERTCADGARQLRAASGPVVFDDLPNEIDGVYFLHSGLRACIEWAAGDAAGKLRLEGEPRTGAITLELMWDGRRQTWQPR